MRMRKKKHGAERIAACSELLIENIEILKDGFDGIFPESRPVHMEIGCGKGNFASGMAAKHQDVNFVAVEKVSDVCCIALEKAKALGDSITRMQVEESGVFTTHWMWNDCKESLRNFWFNCHIFTAFAMMELAKITGEI